jgi:hypothetical protein
LQVSTAGTARWEVTAAGHIIAVADNAYDIGASATANRARNIYAANAITAAGALSGQNLYLTAAQPLIYMGADNQLYFQRWGAGQTMGLIGTGGLYVHNGGIQVNSGNLNVSGTGGFGGNLTTTANFHATGTGLFGGTLAGTSGFVMSGTQPSMSVDGQWGFGGWIDAGPVGGAPRSLRIWIRWGGTVTQYRIPVYSQTEG